MNFGAPLFGDIPLYITCPARAGETQERYEADTLPATESEVKEMLEKR